MIQSKKIIHKINRFSKYTRTIIVNKVTILDKLPTKDSALLKKDHPEQLSWQSQRAGIVRLQMSTNKTLCIALWLSTEKRSLSTADYWETKRPLGAARKINSSWSVTYDRIDNDQCHSFWSNRYVCCSITLNQQDDELRGKSKHWGPHAEGRAHT